jgi:hypothetical protein
VGVFDDHGADGAVFPEVHVGAEREVLVFGVLFVGFLFCFALSLLPADTCALHGDSNLAFLECLAILNLLFAR